MKATIGSKVFEGKNVWRQILKYRYRATDSSVAIKIEDNKGKIVFTKTYEKEELSEALSRISKLLKVEEECEPCKLNGNCVIKWVKALGNT